uniref:HERV-H LTR-associating 2b, tandem duplicate 2 n=1 Tax=Stegastes partitus TaxID=144197 RepID=A0A3B5AUC6_9TELE
MTAIKLSVVFLVLNFLWTSASQDVEHFCNVRERCILPCTFETGDEVVIHWILVKTGEIQAHSFYHSQDQLGHQNQQFRGRTSLFKEQISGGNASLQLTGVKVQDEGRYKCYVSTILENKESFINLKVDAPVHQVNIQQEGTNISCSSEGIYPKPELTWSTTTPELQSTPVVEQTEEQLYSIKSSLILSNSNPDLDYSCTVKTRRNQRTATLFKTTSSSGSSTERKLSCKTPDTPLTGFIWTFNHSQVIVSKEKTDGSLSVSEEWRQQVKHVSESGDITLQDLSSQQEGIYTCELSDAEETYVTNTFLQISGDKPADVVGIAVGVAVGVAFLLVGVLLYLKYCRRNQRPRQKTRNGVKKKKNVLKKLNNHKNLQNFSFILL